MSEPEKIRPGATLDSVNTILVRISTQLDELGGELKRLRRRNIKAYIGIAIAILALASVVVVNRLDTNDFETSNVAQDVQSCQAGNKLRLGIIDFINTEIPMNPQNAPAIARASVDFALRDCSKVK